MIPAVQNDEPKTRGSADAKRWASNRAADFGSAVKAWRKRGRLSASALTERTKELGYPITRGTIARIEGNHRAGKVDVAELLVLSSALGAAPLDLLYPNLPNGEVERLPGQEMASWEAVQHFTGESTEGTAAHSRALFDLTHLGASEHAFDEGYLAGQIDARNGRDDPDASNPYTRLREDRRAYVRDQVANTFGHVVDEDGNDILDADAWLDEILDAHADWMTGRGPA